MSDSVPPSSPPEELEGRREGDKILKSLPKVRIPDMGEECRNNVDPEVSNVVSFTKKRAERARAQRVMRPHDRSMHDISTPKGRRGGVRKSQECSLTPYIEGDLSNKRNQPLVDAIIGGVRQIVDPSLMAGKKNNAKYIGSERIFSLEMAFYNGEMDSTEGEPEDMASLNVIFEKTADELLAFAEENKAELAEADVQSDELFHPVAKILLRTIPPLTLRYYINDARVVSLVRVLKDDSTKRRIMHVLASFLTRKAGDPRGNRS